MVGNQNEACIYDLLLIITIFLCAQLASGKETDFSKGLYLVAGEK